MSDKIGPALKTYLDSAIDSETIDVNIFLKDEPAADVLRERGLANAFDEDVNAVGRIIEGAAASQSDLLSYLADARNRSLSVDEINAPKALTKQTFWINNSVGAEVSREVLDEILNRPDVVHVELSQRVEIEELLDDALPQESFPGTDAEAEPTWSVKLINAPLLWQQGLRGEGVLVAVVDTGVNYDHPDLTSHMWDGSPTYPRHGFDFEDNDEDPRDQHGHGTACAGIVAGDGAAGSKTGVAPEATVMALRAGNTERSLWDAIEFAILRKAHVISMSMTWKVNRHPDYPGWRRTSESILAAGVLHANSSGNQGGDLANFPIPYNIGAPGNCPPPRLHPLQTIVGTLSSAISCGATDDTDSLADFSGRGPSAWEKDPYTDYEYQNGSKMGLIKPDICAPGSGTTSCNWQFSTANGTNVYRSFNGTSAATPYIGGCLALLAQACLASGTPIIPARIQEALEETAVTINGQTKEKENHFGAGRVDVFKAYQYGQNKGWWT